MQLLVDLWDARAACIEVAAGSPVTVLKAELQRETGVPVEQIRLTNGCSSLQDERTVDSYGLDDGSSVTMLIPLRGGIDFQHREGIKFGGGGLMSETQANADRRERLRKLAMETIDLNKDPYFMKNHLGKFECKLCLTLHNTEGNYLAHTQGKRHQQNLARRAAREAQVRSMEKPESAEAARLSKQTIKIGRPGYKVTKSRDLATRQRSLLFEIEYPEADEGVQPRHRFMSAYEQRVEAPNKQYQYLLFACEPYETVAFKIPNEPIDKGEGRFFTNWDSHDKRFSLQLYFADKSEIQAPTGTGGAPKRQVRAINAGVLA